MNGYLVATAASVLGGMVVCGVVAVATGWLLPWLRRRTLRPALWGYGTVLFAAGLLLSMSYGAFDVFDGSPALIDAAFVSSVLMIGTGGYLQVLSTRPLLAS
ncbi:hypothetical protein [Streptomyces sp. GQFP]|uniref:hypothetical protein n=1 Tax=Streptomyces sp. GQFP TaxID=2907545 RepID=UPI001F23B32F|nr:hypothetical protein [Streptomyces sp. GQFP]UIX31032.1 hypothetical protein LUX31_13875 [Streptomyces sp. GQFP]